MPTVSDRRPLRCVPWVTDPRRESKVPRCHLVCWVEHAGRVHGTQRGARDPGRDAARVRPAIGPCCPPPLGIVHGRGGASRGGTGDTWRQRPTTARVPRGRIRPDAGWVECVARFGNSGHRPPVHPRREACDPARYRGSPLKARVACAHDPGGRGGSVPPVRTDLVRGDEPGPAVVRQARGVPCQGGGWGGRTAPCPPRVHGPPEALSGVQVPVEPVLRHVCGHDAHHVLGVVRCVGGGAQPGKVACASGSNHRGRERAVAV